MTVRQIFNHSSGRYVSCGDTDIYIEEIGDPDRPALFMLHGGFGNMEDFNNITPSLAGEFRLVGIDSRGHGKSGLGTSELSYKLLTDDLERIIESLRPVKFSILGFSDGGIVSYRYAARQDSRLYKIITVGSRWELSKDDPVWGMLSGMTGMAWKNRFPSSYESYMHLNPEPDFDRFSRAVVAMWTDLSSHGTPGTLMQKIKSEMLVIRGDNDPLTSLESMAKLRNILENMNFMNIPFAGHIAFDDAAEMFHQAASEFLGVTKFTVLDR